MMHYFFCKKACRYCLNQKTKTNAIWIQLSPIYIQWNDMISTNRTVFNNLRWRLSTYFYKIQNMSVKKSPLNVFREISVGFFNYRTPLNMVGGLIDVGTHMSLCKLDNGNFIVIDTASVDDKAKQDIDVITKSGELIEAVVAAHPYHTLSFESFHKIYPSRNIKWYGTTRHRANIPSVPWEQGDDNLVGPQSPILDKWRTLGVAMRIPEGAEFINPGHFSCVFVFHEASRTLHIDDTLNFFDEDAGFILYTLIFRIFNNHPGNLILHSSAFSDEPDHGVLNTADAPAHFTVWLEKICTDWDFDCICTAHKGRLLSGAKQAVRNLLVKVQPAFKKYSEKHKSHY